MQTGKIGRTSHILLDIAGRKDLSDIEKVACGFVFACKTSGVKFDANSAEDEDEDENGGDDDVRVYEDEIPRISISSFPFPEMFNEKKMTNTEFLDPEMGVAGMVSVPPWVGKEELIRALMVPIISILRQMPKKDAIAFCRKTSVEYADMALTGDIKI